MVGAPGRLAARIGVRVASALSAALVVAVVLVAAGVVILQLVGASMRRNFTGRGDVAAAAIDTLGFYLLLAVPVLIVVVGLVIYFFAGRPLRAVELVRARAASAVQSDPPEPVSQDEVARLSETVNSLLARLGEARTTQQRFAAAGPELRAPLATMAAGLDQFQRGTADRSTLTTLRTETERLGHAIETLLAAAGDPGPVAAAPAVEEAPALEQATGPVSMSGGFPAARPATTQNPYDATTVITPIGPPPQALRPMRDEDAREDPVTAPRGIPAVRPDATGPRQYPTRGQPR